MDAIVVRLKRQSSRVITAPDHQVTSTNISLETVHTLALSLMPSLALLR